MIREPVAVGQFYPSDATELAQAIALSFEPPFGPGAIGQLTPKPLHTLKGLIAPHGNYRFAGYALAQAYARLLVNGPSTTLYILAPSHTDCSSNFAAFQNAVYRTPLGDTVTDDRATHALMKLTPEIIDYPGAHLMEHSLELQLPYVQTTQADAKIVPIICGAIPTDRQGIDVMQRNGEAYAKLLDSDPCSVMIASTNLMRYVTTTTANLMDAHIIEALLSLDPLGLMRRVSELNINMCGLVPSVVLLYAMKALGVTGTELLTHYTSGDVAGGDSSYAVGMASLAFCKE